MKLVNGQLVPENDEERAWLEKKQAQPVSATPPVSNPPVSNPPAPQPSSAQPVVSQPPVTVPTTTQPPVVTATPPIPLQQIPVPRRETLPTAPPSTENADRLDVLSRQVEELTRVAQENQRIAAESEIRRYQAELGQYRDAILSQYPRDQVVYAMICDPRTPGVTPDMMAKSIENAHKEYKRIYEIARVSAQITAPPPVQSTTTPVPPVVTQPAVPQQQSNQPWVQPPSFPQENWPSVVAPPIGNNTTNASFNVSSLTTEEAVRNGTYQKHRNELLSSVVGSSQSFVQTRPPAFNSPQNQRTLPYNTTAPSYPSMTPAFTPPIVPPQPPSIHVPTFPSEQQRAASAASDVAQARQSVDRVISGQLPNMSAIDAELPGIASQTRAHMSQTGRTIDQMINERVRPN